MRLKVNIEIADARNKEFIDNLHIPLQQPISTDTVREGAKRLEFILETCQPGLVPDAPLLGALLDLKGPVVARAMIFLEVSHFVHRLNRGQWPEWIRSGMPMKATSAPLGRGTPSGLRATLKIQKTAGKLFYHWAEVPMLTLLGRLHDTLSFKAINARLVEILDSEKEKAPMTGHFDEQKRIELRINDELEDFLDESVVNKTGDECPNALKLIAVMLLLEITTFLCETYPSITKKVSHSRQVYSQNEQRISFCTADENESSSDSNSNRDDSGIGGEKKNSHRKTRGSSSTGSEDVIHGDHIEVPDFKTGLTVNDPSLAENQGKEDADNDLNYSMNFPWIQVYGEQLPLEGAYDRRKALIYNVSDKIKERTFGIRPKMRRTSLEGVVQKSTLSQASQRKHSTSDKQSSIEMKDKNGERRLSEKRKVDKDRNSHKLMLKYVRLQVDTTSTFIVCAVKQPTATVDLLVNQLQHYDVDFRISAVLRFYTLWRNRFHPWLFMEEGAQAVFKAPPPNIDFSLPSPPVGQMHAVAKDLPWMPQIKTKLQELTLKADTASQSIMTMTKTRRKQKQEIYRRTLQHAEEAKCAERMKYFLLSTSVIQQAAYEPALFQMVSSNTMPTENEDGEAHVGKQIPVAQPLFPSCLCSVVPHFLQLLDDAGVNSEGTSGT
ncbi:unnamed protein product [Soboliphyme baturini]|uniref:Nexin_C domain-containing protein n=1 Tax=Soboliphyme baturini TaxID=241478 RepID=A0A183IQI5_9BILA|nr:unnamed protein product [Soboliphyme baturini]